MEDWQVVCVENWRKFERLAKEFPTNLFFDLEWSGRQSPIGLCQLADAERRTVFLIDCVRQPMVYTVLRDLGKNNVLIGFGTSNDVNQLCKQGVVFHQLIDLQKETEGVLHDELNGREVENRMSKAPLDSPQKNRSCWADYGPGSPKKMKSQFSLVDYLAAVGGSEREVSRLTGLKDKCRTTVEWSNPDAQFDQESLVYAAKDVIAVVKIHQGTSQPLVMSSITRLSARGVQH